MMNLSLFRSLPRSFIRGDLHVLALCVAAWAAFVAAGAATGVTGESVRPNPETVFVLGAGFLTFVILNSLGYFSVLRLLPRKSDVVLVLTAVPAAGVLAHVVTVTLFDEAARSLPSVLLWSPAVSLVVFAGHYAVNLALVRCGRRLRVVLDVLPEEKVSLVQDFSMLDEALEGGFVFLSKNDLREYVLRGREQDIDLIVISRGAAAKLEHDGLVIRAHLAGIPIVDFQKISSTIPGRIRLSDVEGCRYVLDAVPQTILLRAFTSAKVILEPVLAVALGLLFLPLIVVLAAVIKYTSTGPVFYRQVRTGYLGKNFTLIKFRSMYTDAEKDGIKWAAQNDNRVTPVGRFLRKTRLDELPQLWNVIRGEMGFFGPRPERPEIYRELKKEIPLFSLRTVVRPGITGWAQVCAGYAASVEQSATKLEYDLFYIQNISPRLDLVILFKTLSVAVMGDKANKKGVVEEIPFAVVGN